MRRNRKRRALLQELEDRVGEGMAQVSGRMSGHVASSVRSVRKLRSSARSLAVTAACVAGALAVLAGGLYAGKELRSRYKVKRRTPYDYYAHAGDRRRTTDLEFGVGI